MARLTSRLASAAGGLLRADRADGERGLTNSIETLRWMMSTRLVVGLAAVSVIGSTIEALALVLLVRLATVLASGEDVVAFEIGPTDFGSVSVGTVLVICAALVTVRLVMNLVAAGLTGQASSSTLSLIRLQLVDAFLGSTWSTQAADRAGLLQDLATTHAKAGAKAAVWVSMGIVAAFNLATMAVAALVIDPVVVAIMGLAVVVLFVALRPITTLVRRHARTYARFNTRYASEVAEIGATCLETNTFGVADGVGDRHRSLTRRASRYMFNVTALSRSVSGLYQSLALLALVGGMWVVSSNASTELSSLGSVIAILLRALSYGQAFQVAQHNLQEQLPFVEDVREQVRRYQEDVPAFGDRPLGPIQDVAVEGLSFRHGEERVLEDISFRIRAGEAIGIMGPSGAGKSTLAQLLLRLRRPEEGRYLVNGEDARSFSTESWSSRVAFVPQAPVIIRGSVRENVSFFRDLAPEQVEAACRMANIHDEVLEWADGYDTELGSGANPLSGGQRQRLCIARALAGQPDLLLLDEPTSALDMRSEAAIQEALGALRGRMTLVIIAHRVPTLRMCDRVVVLRAGRIEGIGSPEALLEADGFFAEAVRLSTL